MKKFAAMLLAVSLCSSLAACSGNTASSSAAASSSSAPASSTASSSSEAVSEPAEIVYDYTFNTYAESLGTNWNPHTWEMNGDNVIQDYVLAPLADMTIKDSETGEYQWIFVAATDIKDVTAEHQDDLTKYAVTLPADKTADQVTEGYVYEIALRPEMTWEDGTPINADTYVYSMQQLLSPEMKNYRANNYYSGESAIAGAESYFFSGSIATMDNGNTSEITALTDLTKGDDGVYTTADGLKVWINLTSASGYLGGNSLKDYVDAYGETVFDMTAWEALNAAADENGNVSVTDETWAELVKMITTDGWGEDETYAPNYLNYEKQYEEGSWENVGLYKVDDYTIRYVCQTAYDYYYFLTSMTSNWIVHEEMYEACKDTSGELVTSNYCTSAETTMSCYAYRIESLQDQKQLVLVQNENYWEFDKNDDGTLSSTTFFEVDGEQQPQFQTQKIVIDVMTNDAAKLAFLSGQVDEWTPAADEVAEYSTSEQLYKVDETYTQRLFFHTDLDALKAMDQAGNTNSVVMSNYKFRQAMSLALNRAEFVTATPGYKPAFSMLSSLYFYDVYNDPASIYRNTDQAKQAIVNLYGVEYGDGTIYADLDAAHDSINGYNLTEAKALFTEACAELVAEGLYTEGENIVIEIGWAKGSKNSSDEQQITLLNKYMNEALEGTGFGTIELKGIDNLNNRYNDVANGVYAIGWGAWGGAAFYPFTMFQVYCDPDYVDPIHEQGCWSPAVETLTLNVNGEDVTMTWKEWSGSMAGTGKYATADMETKLSILAGIEENFLKKYYCIPVCTTTVCSMLSYKTSYYTEDYNIMYGFGGLRLQSFNYTNDEWTEFVNGQNGQVAY